jgi:hypothetical protein
MEYRLDFANHVMTVTFFQQCILAGLAGMGLGFGLVMGAMVVRLLRQYATSNDNNEDDKQT